MNQNFIQVDGLDLVYQGKKIYLQGVTLGNWLILEDHMSGIPYVEHKARDRFSAVLGKEIGEAFFDTYQETYITEKDAWSLSGYFAALASCLIETVSS